MTMNFNEKLYDIAKRLAKIIIKTYNYSSDFNWKEDHFVKPATTCYKIIIKLIKDKDLVIEELASKLNVEVLCAYYTGAFFRKNYCNEYNPQMVSKRRMMDAVITNTIKQLIKETNIKTQTTKESCDNSSYAG